MGTQNDDYRAFQPGKDEHLAVARAPEVDAMADQESVSQQALREEPSFRSRVVARDEADGGRTIAVFVRDEETDRLSDEELLARIDEWKRSRRHLRAVEDGPE